MTFWCILKWEEVADSPHSSKWLVLIAYLIGLSIGVHLLSLLTIPAMGMIYYFKNNEYTHYGAFKALMTSTTILLVIQGILIPKTASLMGIFDRIFVNDFGLPFNSGVLFFFLLIIGLIIFGLFKTREAGNSTWNTAILGILVLLIGNIGEYQGFSALWSWLLRWCHVVAGIMWIGLLYYFNFVQIPNMGNIPDEQKPAIGKVIAPAALWWFRWAAMATIVFGIILAHDQGYLLEAILLSEGYWAIGIGMYLGTIMFLNVWLVIWPNQQRALGLVEADAETKASSAKMAMLFSRTNTVLSIPMLVSMTVHQNLFA